MQNCYDGTKGPELCEDGNINEEFNMEELDLNIEKYEELFGVSHYNPELLENDGIDSLFGTKDTSEANRQAACVAEVFSISTKGKLSLLFLCLLASMRLLNWIQCA